VIGVPKLAVFYNLKLMGFAFTPANVRRLRSLVHQHRPDILHHVNHIFDTNFLSTMVARSSRLPIVGSITTPVQHQSPWKQSVMGLADRMTIGKFGVSRWDGVVSLDHTIHDYVGEMYGSQTQARSVVIPFGVRLESMSDYNNSLARSERQQILFVGHIHPFRNPVKLVQAMPLILKSVPEVRLVLAGRVDLQEPVRVARKLGLTSDQVQFLGETPHDGVVRLIKTSHIFASWVTGPYHSLGTAPMEAMLCNTPVVNDLPENLFGEGKLKNGENIILVDSRDPHSIASGIIRVLTDEQLRQRIGAQGRRFVLEHLSWDSIAAQMEGFYERILAQKGARASSEEQLHV
jgi:glycosyltransferase involved in cell wall biosynthesis